MLVKDVLWGICDLLQDTDPQFLRWPERTLVRFLNDAQLATCKYLPLACTRIDAVLLKRGTLQSVASIAPADCKTFDGSTPSAPILGFQFVRALCNMGADGLTIGRGVRLADAELLDAQDPMWNGTEGTTVREFTFDPESPAYFRVTPGAGVDPQWLRIVYAAQPVPIPAGGAPGAELFAVDGSSTLPISIADEHVDLLTYYVLARCYMRNSQNAGDPAKVAQFGGMWLQGMNSKVAAVTGANPNLTKLPFAETPLAQAN